MPPVNVWWSFFTTKVPGPVFTNFKLPVSAIFVLVVVASWGTSTSSDPTCSAEFVTVNALTPPASAAGSLRSPPLVSNTVPSPTTSDSVLVKSKVAPAAFVNLFVASTNAAGETAGVTAQIASYSAAVVNRTCMLPVTLPPHSVSWTPLV